MRVDLIEGYEVSTYKLGACTQIITDFPSIIIQDINAS